ncbi:MAG: YkvA family protein [Acidaminococcaceae bacterium]
MVVKCDQQQLQAEELAKYQKGVTPEKLTEKITRYAQVMGAKLFYEVLVLWYVTRKPEVPTKVKTTIYGAIGYLITPLDFIPDLVPLTGYTDDVVAIAFALSQARAYIDEDIKLQAKADVTKLFGAQACTGLD